MNMKDDGRMEYRRRHYMVQCLMRGEPWHDAGGEDCCCYASLKDAKAAARSLSQLYFKVRVLRHTEVDREVYGATNLEA